MQESPASSLDQKIESQRLDPEIALLIGLVYLLSLLILPSVMEGVGIPRLPQAEYLTRHGTVHALTIALIGLPPILMLFLYMRYTEASFLKLQVGGEKHALIGGFFVAGCFAFFILDKLGVVPFTWRTPGNTSVQYTRILVETRAVIGIGLLAVAGVIITPILEEIIFRFGVLQWTLQRTNSWVLSITSSALVFGLAHTTAFSQNNPRLAVETFVFGVFAGWCVFRRQGRIGIAFALHSAKNTVELATLIAAASARLR